MSYLYTIVLCVVGFMIMLKQVGSWMARGGAIEWFEVPVVGVV